MLMDGCWCYGWLLVPMDTNGWLLVPMDTYGWLLVPVEANGWLLVPMDAMDANGCLWMAIGAYGC